MLRSIAPAVTAAALLGLAAAAHAQPSTDFVYQGRLAEAGGAYTGTADIVVRLMTAPGGGVVLATDTNLNVSVQNGLFTLNLAFPPSLYEGADRWLEFDVRTPAGVGGYTTLAPRQPLQLAPYAVHALGARQTSGSTYLLGDLINVNTSTSFAGVGRSSRVSTQEFFGVNAPVDTGFGGMYVRTNGGNALPFYGYSAGGGADAFHYYSGATNDWFLNIGTTRLVVDGDTGNVGIGTTSPGFRLDVAVDGANARAVSAVASGSQSIGVRGQGLATGVEGISTASNGQGVYGRGNNSAQSSGVRAIHPTTGAAVYATTTNGIAVYAISNFGQAGLFQGNVSIQGNLTKSSGNFRIDHPLDPENRFLLHSFVESPEMLNIYAGEAVTDETGHAAVALPDWFDALNADLRYQLTVVDDSEEFVLAKVAREFDGRSFLIRTSHPNTRVCWQITGVRDDPYARANPVRVELDKQPHERGRYLHPEVYGLPADRAIIPFPIEN